MCRDFRVFASALLLLGAVVAAACGSPQPPADTVKPVEPPGPAVDIKNYMHDHLGHITAIHEAVIRGDLEAVAQPASWIANAADVPVPASAATYRPDVKKTAAMAAGAKDLKSAATATAQLVAACGACHLAAKATVVWAEPVKPAEGTGAAPHMLEHQWALDLMYQGLARPSDETWNKGVAALKASPLVAKDLPKDEKLTKDIIAYEQSVHALADRATVATDIGSKVAVYSEAIASCAGCHGLHGKVWGPGIPK